MQQNHASADFQRQLRNCLGQFATGVAVVTTLTPEGQPLGLTINSFNSVSLNPPLVLWSLGNQSATMQAFSANEHFVVNILAAEQEPVSNAFAWSKEDPFLTQPWTAGVGGAPVLPGCIATFQCRRVQQVAGGDHQIFIGEVVEFSQQAGEPLLYFSGAYRQLAAR